MSRIKLDLSSFKHVKSDEHTTTLQHKQGHLLTIANKALSKEGQEQLKALSKIGEDAQTKTQSREEAQKFADGGDIKKKSNTVVTGKASDGVMTANKIRAEGEKTPNGVTIQTLDKEEHKVGKIKDKDGKKPEVFAEGGEVPEYLSKDGPVENAVVAEDPLLKATEVPTIINAPSQEETNQINEKRIQDEMEKIKAPGNYTGQDPLLLEQAALKNISMQQDSQKMAEQEQIQQAQQRANLQAQNNAQRAKLGMGPSTQGTGPVEAATQQSNATQQQAQQPGQGAVSQLMPNTSSGLNTSDAEGMLHGGYQSQLSGINAEAKAVGELGQKQSQVLDNNVIHQQAALDEYKKTFNMLSDERLAAIQDVKDGYINPEKYWTGDPKTGEGSHSKIATGIGMILAGFSPSNTPNAAIDFLKFQMGKNLEAQARNLGSKETLLAHNLDQFKNLKDATEMTRIMQNDMLSHQLDSAAAMAKTPMAQAAAKQAAGKLMMESSSLFQNFAMRRAMMNAASGGPGNDGQVDQLIAYSRVMNPEMAKEMMARRVPGIGMANIPVPTEVRDQFIAHDKVDAMATKLKAFAQKHTTINPMSDNYKVGQQLALDLQQALREAKLGGVFKESEQQLLDMYIDSNPAGLIKGINTDAKLHQLLRTNVDNDNILRKHYGLPQHQVSARDNPPIKGVDGRMYMKDPSGKFMIPVKSK